MTYDLATDGDRYEQLWYPKFIQSEFPSYAAFWAKHVAPLTNRPINIQFKSDSDLAAIGKGPADLCAAQLHYTLFKHLVRTYEIRNGPSISMDLLTEAIVRLTGAQDVAFELLERFKNPSLYAPWLDKKTGADKGSKEARKKWQERENHPLRRIREYRNHLVHGRISPTVSDGNQDFVPDIGRELAYYDWRSITQHPDPALLLVSEFVSPARLLDSAWNETTGYFETNWKKHLL